jgi:hypothetical protein
MFDEAAKLSALEVRYALSDRIHKGTPTFDISNFGEAIFDG